MAIKAVTVAEGTARAVLVGAGDPMAQTLAVGEAAGSTLVTVLSPASDTTVGCVVGDAVGLDVAVK